MCYWSFVVYSADVVDCHRAPRAERTSDETPDAPTLPQNDHPVHASTLPESRAVIILVPVRLGGEKTNPEYFDFAKVKNASRFEWLKNKNPTKQILDSY